MNMRTGPFLVAALAGACGGSPTPAASTRPAPSVTPIAVQAAAKSPSRALILGTDARGGRTVVPLAGVEQKVAVDALWVRWTRDGYEGGLTEATLTTGPNEEHEVRVGVFEDVAGGAGSQWRSGVWLAAFVATTVLNKDLTDFTFSAASRGHIDGASASGLMTAGFVASMTGTPIDPAATMTGVINPDGTIGPVGGIPQKFAGAITRGKQRIGYPVGMRYAVDADSGERTDLVALAREHGVEAVEVTDVYAAYRLMTGKTLPRPVPVSEAAMALDDATVGRIEERYRRWAAMYDEAWTRLRALAVADGLQPGQRELVASARAEQAAAQRLMEQGLAVSAYPRMARAWVYAAAAAATSDVLEPALDGDDAGARAALAQVETLAGVADETVRRIGAMKPATMGDHLRMLSSFDAVIAGLAADRASGLARARLGLERVAALGLVERMDEDVALELAANLTPAMLALARGVAASALADDTLHIEQSASIDYRCSLPDVRRLARSFASAAGSNLAYLDGLAQSARYDDPEYGLARFAAAIGEPRGPMAELQEEWGKDSIAWGLFALAASELSYFRTSVMVSKWYSLGARTDWTGRARSVEYEKAFAHMLAFAETRARENARAALVATGEIPLQARLRYQQARFLREGDVADKLGALEAYWAASTYAQTAVMLARN